MDAIEPKDFLSVVTAAGGYLLRFFIDIRAQRKDRQKLYSEWLTNSGEAIRFLEKLVLIASARFYKPETRQELDDLLKEADLKAANLAASLNEILVAEKKRKIRTILSRMSDLIDQVRGALFATVEDYKRLNTKMGELKNRHALAEQKLSEASEPSSNQKLSNMTKKTLRSKEKILKTYKEEIRVMEKDLSSMVAKNLKELGLILEDVKEVRDTVIDLVGDHLSGKLPLLK